VFYSIAIRIHGKHFASLAQQVNEIWLEAAARIEQRASLV
jgi:hypothetical protein